MERRDLEQRLKGMQRTPAPENLDQRVGALFDGAEGRTAAPGLESRLGRLDRVPVPASLDQRMDALFRRATDTPARRPWRIPAWTMAAAGLVLALVFLARGWPGPAPVVVEITPQGQLEQFLLGGEAPVTAEGLELFTRGQCTVETVWPANAPGLDRHPVNGSNGNGDG